jgi:hypothetical protein
MLLKNAMAQRKITITEQETPGRRPQCRLQETRAGVAGIAKMASWTTAPMRAGAVRGSAPSR